MKKGIMNIYLIKRPIVESNNRIKGLDYDMLGNGRESVLIIKACLLGKALYDEVCFVSFNGTICPIFDLVNPFTSNGFLVRWPRNKIPSVVEFKCT